MTDVKLLQIKLKLELWNRITAAAQLDNRTITGWVRHLINKALEEVKHDADV